MIRTEIKSFQEIPNVGKATEQDFILLGLKQPQDLVDQDPYQMYQTLCNLTNKKHDPCVIDVFISAVEYMKGGSAKKWWEFTQQRKQKLTRSR
jgi:hypothetical protein